MSNSAQSVVLSNGVQLHEIAGFLALPEADDYRITRYRLIVEVNNGVFTRAETGTPIKAVTSKKRSIITVKLDDGAEFWPNRGECERIGMPVTITKARAR